MTDKQAVEINESDLSLVAPYLTVNQLAMHCDLSVDNFLDILAKNPNLRAAILKGRANKKRELLDLLCGVATTSLDDSCKIKAAELLLKTMEKDNEKIEAGIIALKSNKSSLSAKEYRTILDSIIIKHSSGDLSSVAAKGLLDSISKRNHAIELVDLENRLVSMEMAYKKTCEKK